MKPKPYMVLVSVVLAVGTLILLVCLNEFSKGDLAWCIGDQDQCRIDAMDKHRVERDAEDKRIEAMTAEMRKVNHEKHDPIINALKGGLSANRIVKEAEAGRKENVPEKIVSFNFIPKAFASTGDTLLDVPQTTSAANVSVRFAPNWISVGRYGKVLADLGSPYASVPIEKYCNEAQVTQYQCDVLVGITFQESEVGKRFAKKDANGVIVPADQLGAISYNPAGLKGGGLTYPTPEGFYLRPFKSWDDFWQQYPGIMKAGYFDRGGNTPESISKCYVRGDCVKVKDSWVNGVKSFMAKLN